MERRFFKSAERRVHGDPRQRVLTFSIRLRMHADLKPSATVPHAAVPSLPEVCLQESTHTSRPRWPEEHPLYLEQRRTVVSKIRTYLTTWQPEVQINGKEDKTGNEGREGILSASTGDFRVELIMHLGRIIKTQPRPTQMRSLYRMIKRYDWKKDTDVPG